MAHKHNNFVSIHKKKINFEILKSGYWKNNLIVYFKLHSKQDMLIFTNFKKLFYNNIPMKLTCLRFYTIKILFIYCLCYFLCIVKYKDEITNDFELFEFPLTVHENALHILKLIFK